MTLAGEKDVFGLWAGTGGEGAKFWMRVLTDIKNRGVWDKFFLVCDGLKSPPRSGRKQCVAHNHRADVRHPLIRNTFKLATKKDCNALKRDGRPIYAAVSQTAARTALEELTEKWGKKYGAIIRLWEPAWEEFIPFLDYDLPDPHRDLLDEHDRVVECEVSAGRAGLRALPDWVGSTEEPVSCHSLPQPLGRGRTRGRPPKDSPPRPDHEHAAGVKNCRYSLW